MFDLRSRSRLVNEVAVRHNYTASFHNIFFAAFMLRLFKRLTNKFTELISNSHTQIG
jgi:hypothetical protein